MNNQEIAKMLSTDDHGVWTYADRICISINGEFMGYVKPYTVDGSKLKLTRMTPAYVARRIASNCTEPTTGPEFEDLEYDMTKDLVLFKANRLCNETFEHRLGLEPGSVKQPALPEVTPKEFP